MSDKKQWDLTSTNSMQGAAEWIRKRGAAQLVLVIRAHDVAFAVDPALGPMDAVDLVRGELPALLQHLIDHRARKAPKR